MQEMYSYPIKKNHSINRWWLTQISKIPFSSPKSTFEQDINLGEGYVQIIYPVRKEFLAKNYIDSIELYTGDYKKLYFPFENNRVDFTDFIFTPHYLYLFAKTCVVVPERGEYEFELFTCGGVKLWVNNEEVITFKPYTRNVQSSIKIKLILNKGLNTLNIYADELAERDVFYYFELRYLGEKEINGAFYINESVDSVKNIEALLESFSFERDLFIEEDISLVYDNGLLNGEQRIEIESDGFASSYTEQDVALCSKSYIISSNSNVLHIAKVEDFSATINDFFIRATVGDIVIERKLFMGIHNKKLREIKPEKDIKQRKKQAIEYIAKYGKSNINKTIAILESQRKMTNSAYRAYKTTLDYIQNKKDCADFYFPVMLRMLTTYKEFLSEEDRNELKEAILDFRYWIDEPGDDVMWFFSENHAFLFHTSQYLAGLLYPDEVFYRSQKTGREQTAIAKERLVSWFEHFCKYGYAEWNSITYIPIDLIGLFVLYDMAVDEEIKSFAKKGLDFTFELLATYNFNGIVSSSYGRCYEHSLKGRELTEPSFIEWITAGKGFINHNDNATLLYSLSDYEPDDYYNRVDIKESEALEVQLLQGVNKVKVYAYITKQYNLCCAINYNPFVHGHQQHISNIALGEKSVQLYINHPGERPFSGGGRPAYWAGNGTAPLSYQYKNVQLLQYRIEEKELVHYIHMYTPLYDFDEYRIENNWFFVRVDDAYLGIYFDKGYKLTDYGANRNKELISMGLNHNLVIVCSSKHEYCSFEHFVSSQKLSKVAVDSLGFSYSDHKNIYSINSENRFYVNDKEASYDMDYTVSVKKCIVEVQDE